jgi:hypothetical protein
MPTRLRGRLIVVLLGAAGLASGQGAQPTGGNPSDFYYVSGQPVYLQRSFTECVVSFAPGAGRERLAVIQRLYPSAGLGIEIPSGGRAFHVVTIPAVDGSAGAAPLLARLRSEAAIEFAAPVFYHPSTHSRMLPTGEIIVKLKAGRTRRDLDETADAAGLTVVRLMAGTRDEYVLRLRPNTGEPIEASRALYDTGRFQWAEPNFIQQYKR